jgi:hypothetical protein
MTRRLALRVRSTGFTQSLKRLAARVGAIFYTNVARVSTGIVVRF